MIIVFTSDDSGYCERVARRRIQKDHPDLDYSMDFVRLDLGVDSLTQLVSEAQTGTFTGEKKVILVVNPIFLKEEGRKKKSQDREVESFVSYLENPSSDTDIYICAGKTLGKTGCAKVLREKARLEDRPMPTGIERVQLANRIILDMGSTIQRDALNELVERAGDSYWSLRNACERLSLYSKDIDMEAVETLVPRKPEDRIYELTNLLLRGDASGAVGVYRDIRRNDPPINVLYFLFSDFRMDACVQYLFSSGMTEDQVADTMGIKPYRARMIRQKLGRKLSYEACLEILAQLADMEKSIKFDLDDPDIRIEEFLLSFGKYSYLTA